MSTILKSLFPCSEKNFLEGVKKVKFRFNSKFPSPIKYLKYFQPAQKKKMSTIIPSFRPLFFHVPRHILEGSHENRPVTSLPSPQSSPFRGHKRSLEFATRNTQALTNTHVISGKPWTHWVSGTKVWGMLERGWRRRRRRRCPWKGLRARESSSGGRERR